MNVELTFSRNVHPNIVLQVQNAVLVVKKTPQNFYQCIGQIIDGDFTKFCGLLRIYEL